MRQATRFVVMLLLGLGALTVVANFALTRVMRSWFLFDVNQRSRLAYESARRSLERNWEDPATLHGVLTAITRDEHIMAAAACQADGSAVTQTPHFPADFSCAAVHERLKSEGTVGREWGVTTELPLGPVHVSALTAGDLSRDPFVLLVHDLSYVSRRDDTARRFLLTAFMVLALAVSVITLIATRLAQRGWMRQLREALVGGGASHREFAPLAADLRALLSSLHEDQQRREANGWTPERLRSTLKESLQGERIVVLANREPYIHEKTDAGIRVVHPASGLVTALEPVMRACGGVWVAHGSGTADRETVDAKNRLRVPPGEGSYWLRRVWLSEQEEAGYYYGFSNEGLWPLCHVAHQRPEFRASDFEQYRQVNRRFADAVVQEVDVDNPIILVQDYHFALAPALIRARLPRATILTFWHIPWPNSDRFGICPWRNELLEGLLGSSIIGFHTQQHCNSFLTTINQYLECRIDREMTAVEKGRRRTLVRPYPISIEWPVHWLDTLPSPERCREEVHAELKLPKGCLLGVGVDRLDYTKGIEERLSAVDTLLERYPEFRGRFTFAQLAAPSRTRIGPYRDLSDRVEKLAERINQRWGTAEWRPIVLWRAHHEPPTVFKFFRAADVCYVSSLHDGMNLVAKEFIAARSDNRGVLMLSQFTGAARELPEALVVNPYNLEQAADAFAAALKMPPAEQAARMQSMRRLVSQLNVYRWAGRMIIDAAQLRNKERLTGQLTDVPELARRVFG